MGKRGPDLSEQPTTHIRETSLRMVCVNTYYMDRTVLEMGSGDMGYMRI